MFKHAMHNAYICQQFSSGLLKLGHIFKNIQLIIFYPNSNHPEENWKLGFCESRTLNFEFFSDINISLLCINSSINTSETIFQWPQNPLQIGEKTICFFLYFCCISRYISCCSSADTLTLAGNIFLSWSEAGFEHGLWYSEDSALFLSLMTQ